MNAVLLIIPFVLLKTLADNTYTVSTGDSQKRCLKCPPGTYIVKDCQEYDQNSTVCRTCPKDRFTEAWNAYSSCKACMAHCEGENEIMTTACQANHDIVCGCDQGFWREMHGTSRVNCLPFFKCAEGHGVDTPGTNITDVTCTACIKGVSYSSIVSNSEPCKPCRDCQKEGWNQTQPCTVISNAECDVKTTPEPALKTTSNSKSGNRVTQPTAENPITIHVAVTVCAAAIICLLALVCICYNCRRRCQRNEQRRDPAVSFSNQVSVDTSSASRGISFRSVNLQTIRQDISELILKPDITLENDVFTWLGRKLTRGDFKIIYKSLPGERIKKEDIDAAKYRKPGLDEVITNVFDIWKRKNQKGENELFRDIFATLVYAKKADLSQEMKERFAC